jgi:hypothetical protein
MGGSLHKAVLHFIRRMRAAQRQRELSFEDFM